MDLRSSSFRSTSSPKVPLFAQYGCETGTIDGSICNGWLMKKPTNNKCGFKKRRYFILLPNAILYYVHESKSDEKWAKRQPRGIFILSHKSELHYDSEQGSITISGSKDGIRDRNTLTVFATHDDEKEVLDQWLDFLNGAIEQLSKKWRKAPIPIDKRKSFLPDANQRKMLLGEGNASMSLANTREGNDLSLVNPTYTSSSPYAHNTQQSEGRYHELYGGDTFTAGVSLTSANSFKGSGSMQDYSYRDFNSQKTSSNTINQDGLNLFGN